MGGQWKGGGLTEKSNAEMKTCHAGGTRPWEPLQSELAWRLKSVLPVGFLQHQGRVFSGGVRR